MRVLLAAVGILWLVPAAAVRAEPLKQSGSPAVMAEPMVIPVNRLEPLPSNKPVGYSYPYFEEIWNRRRQALQQGDSAGASVLLVELRIAKERAGWPDFFIFSDALVTESRAAMAAHDFHHALELAQAAVSLGPHRPGAHTALSAALWAGGDLGASIATLNDALTMLLREPPLVWTRLGNLAVSMVVALLLSAIGFAAFIFYRHGTRLFHDIGHAMPVGASATQKRLFLATFILLPFLYRTGAVSTCIVWLLFLAPYYTRRETAAAAILLISFALAPLALPQLTSYWTYPGSRAEERYLVARDAGADEAALQMAGRTDTSAEDLLVLGMRARWSGDLTRARNLLAQASTLAETLPQAQVEIGNVSYLTGDAPAGIVAYNKALALLPGYTLALFNASQIYPVAGDQLKADECRHKANDINHPQVVKYDSLTQAIGLPVVEPAVPHEVLLLGSAPTPEHAYASLEFWQRIGGSSPRWLNIAFALFGLGVLFAAKPLGVRYKLTGRCQRCGLAACRRCHPELQDTQSCRDCFIAFNDDGTTHQQVRIQKEIESHRFYAKRLKVQRAASIFVAGAGAIIRGGSLLGLALMFLFMTTAVALLMGFGLLPDPILSYSGLNNLFNMGYGVVAVAVYVFALINGQREEV